jgi:hypothetical protein
MARVTGLEPATSGVTGRHSNRLSYTRALDEFGWPRSSLAAGYGVHRQVSSGAPWLIAVHAKVF